MNDEQRQALMEELTQAQHDAWPGLDADFIVNTEAIMPIIDRLLADRAATVAEPDEENVEAVAKAMFQSLRPIWGDDIPAEEIPEGDDPDQYYEYSISWEQWNKYGYGLDYDSLSEMRADDLRKMARAAIAAMPSCSDAEKTP